MNIPDETMQLDSVMKAAGKERSCGRRRRNTWFLDTDHRFGAGTQELLGFMKKPKVVPLDSEKAWKET